MQNLIACRKILTNRFTLRCDSPHRYVVLAKKIKIFLGHKWLFSNQKHQLQLMAWPLKTADIYFYEKLFTICFNHLILIEDGSCKYTECCQYSVATSFKDEEYEWYDPKDTIYIFFSQFLNLQNHYFKVLFWNPLLTIEVCISITRFTVKNQHIQYA